MKTTFKGKTTFKKVPPNNALGGLLRALGWYNKKYKGISHPLDILGFECFHGTLQGKMQKMNAASLFLPFTFEFDQLAFIRLLIRFPLIVEGVPFIFG